MTDSATPQSAGTEPRPDRVMRLLEGFVAGYARVVSRTPSKPVAAVDRDLKLIVSHTKCETSDVIGVTLAAADVSELPEWTPGAHLDLLLPSGRLRQYSLCGDPTDRSHYKIAVRRIDDGNGGSIEVHELRNGTAVTVRGPRNAFPFAYPHLAKRDIGDIAFIAGGIGITALLPMIRAAADANITWSLTYVGRDAASMPFLGRIADLPGGDVRLLHGRPSLDLVLAPVDARTSVYFCGPPPFLDVVSKRLRTHPHAGFHFERFVPPPIIGGHPFTVRLARSGREIEVPDDRSALAAIRDVLPSVPYSCQQGFCGTCRVRLIAGNIDRRGTSPFLASPDTVLICVDRAAEKKTITLDL